MFYSFAIQLFIAVSIACIWLPSVRADSWNLALSPSEQTVNARRGHSSLLVDDMLVVFGGRHNFLQDQRNITGQVNINLPPSTVNGSIVWAGPNAPQYVCPYGCFGNGKCTIPGVDPNKIASGQVATASSMLTSYGLQTDVFEQGVYVTASGTTLFSYYDTSMSDMVRAACGLKCSPCIACGTCVCDESYSGEYCHLLEKDVFLEDITYYNFTSKRWWSRVPTKDSNRIITENWPGMRSNHAAVILQAAVPYTLPLDNPNGTMIWETNQKEATADFYKNGMKFYNGTQYYGPSKPMLVIYGGVSPSCGDYCYDVWIWDFSTQTWFSEYSFASGLLNGVANPEAGPLNRWNAGSLVYDNQMVVVHGHRMHKFLDDIWSFDAEHMKWTQIKPKLAPFRARGISSACQCYTDPNATFPSEGSCFGPGTWNSAPGVKVSVGPFNRPSARMGVAVLNYLDGFYMFGGYSDTNNCPYYFDIFGNPGVCQSSPRADYIQDFWYFNFTSSTWRCDAPTTTAVMPDKRQGATLVLVDDFLVYLYGGYTNNQYFSDVWRFNISSGFWTMQLIFRGQNLLPNPRAFHTMHYWKPFNGFFIFGGYGSNSSGTATYFESDYNDMWYFNVSECPNACNGRGKCLYGFCYCEDEYYGTDCQNEQCPDDYCVYDLITNVQSCQHCYGHGNCVSGICRCYDNFDGDSCGNLLCPNDCWQHGVCILEEGSTLPTCLCNPPYGGVDCQRPICLNNCTNRGTCTVNDLTAGCVCNAGFAGEDCALVSYS